MRIRLIAALFALLGVASFAWWSDLTGVHTPAERAAIAYMREPLPALGERNAFAALWLSRYDIPEERLEAQVAEDLARWRSLQDLEPLERRKQRIRFASTAHGRYAQLPTTKGWPVLCFVWEPDCLARVHADPERTRRELASVAAYLDRVDRLERYDHHSNPLQRYGSVGAPPLATALAAVLSEAALRQVDGDPGADDRLCRVAANLRRLRARSDDIGFIGVAQSFLTGAGRVYADLRAERPWDSAADDACGRAFAPLEQSELDLCRGWRRWYQTEHETPDTTLLAGPEGPSWLERVGWSTLDYRADDAAWARLLTATYCSEDRGARIKARARLSYDPALLTCNAGERLFRPALCAGKELALPRFGEYQDLLLDLDARFSLIALADDLARLPAIERAAAFARRPRMAIEDTHPFAFEQATLSAPLLMRRFEERAEVRLPGSSARNAQADGGRR